MATARRFTDLEAWQLCMSMSDLIIELTDKGPVTKNEEFCDQIRTAAEKSAPLIAEGFIRFTTPKWCDTSVWHERKSARSYHSSTELDDGTTSRLLSWKKRAD
jgi:hypothetical protein